MTPRHVDRRWKNRVARERKHLENSPDQAVCWLCGDHINMELPTGHARAFTLDHIVPIASGGDLHGEARPAHRACNSARGNGHTKARTNATIIEW